jgi:hypothetical protein
MRAKITSLFLTAALLFFCAAPVASAATPFNPLGDACKNAPANPACHQNSAQIKSGTNPTINIIQTAANIIAIVAGIGAVIMIIISGIMFATAGGATPGQRSGDPNKIKSAQATLFNALIGLVIIALAWTIVTVVTTWLT